MLEGGSTFRSSLCGLYSGMGDWSPKSSLVGNVFGQFVKGGGGGNMSSERKENLSGINSFALSKVFLSRLKDSLRTGIGGFFGAGLVTPLTFRLLRLCEFVRNFSTLEVTAGKERTVKVELSRDEQMSSNNCDSSV